VKTLTKKDVNYRLTHIELGSETGRAPGLYRPHERCATCLLFQSPESCGKIKGRISRDGVCDRWTSKN